MKLTKPLLRLLSLAAALAVGVGHAEQAAPVYGLDNLLQAVPQVADTIRPSQAVSSEALDTPARRELRETGMRKEASAVPVSVPTQIDWHAITQEAFRRNAPAEKPAVVPAVAAPETEPVAEDPTQVRGARARLLSSLSHKPLVAAAPVERLVPTVSDLNTFRVKSVRQSTDTYIPSAVDYPRHNSQTGRASKQAAQGYTQGFTAP